MKIIYSILILINLLPTLSIANGLPQNKLSDKVMSAIFNQYPNAVILTDEYYFHEVRELIKYPFSKLSGDFDCNGIMDTTLQIYHDNRTKLIVVHELKNGEYTLQTLSESGQWKMKKGDVSTFLSLKKKGERVEFYCNCKLDKEQEICKNYADNKSPYYKGCSVTLQCDAIERVFFKKAHGLFFYEKETNKYNSVVNAD